MSYVFNFEIMSNGVCINKVDDFLQISKSIASKDFKGIMRFQIRTSEWNR